MNFEGNVSRFSKEKLLAGEKYWLSGSVNGIANNTYKFMQ